MAGVRSLLVLARDRAALADAHAALSALGFAAGWEPTALGHGVTSAAVRAGPVTLELLDAPPAQVAWHSWRHRSQRLALLAAGVGVGCGASTPLAGEGLHALQQLAAGGRHASGLQAWLPSSWAGLTPRDGAAVLALEPTGGGSGEPPAPAPLPSPSLASLKEVVIGSTTDGLAASLAALARHGATARAPSHSVFSFGSNHVDSDETAPPSAAVRLLPSRYSCLVLRSPGPLALVQRVLASHSPDASASVMLRVAEALVAAGGASHEGASSPRAPPPDDDVDDGFFFGPPRRRAGPSELVCAAPPMGWEAAVYGVRSGDPRSAQLLLRGGPLAGLDVRFCAQRPGWHAPFFNEGPEAYAEDVDPALNPPPGDARASAPLSCQSVSGMEVLSQVRARLGFRREGGAL